MTKYNLEEMLAKLRNGELCTKGLPAEEVTYTDITSEDEIENLPNKIKEMKKKIEKATIMGWIIYEDDEILMVVTEADKFHTEESIIMIPKGCIPHGGRVPLKKEKVRVIR